MSLGASIRNNLGVRGTMDRLIRKFAGWVWREAEAGTAFEYVRSGPCTLASLHRVKTKHFAARRVAPKPMKENCPSPEFLVQDFLPLYGPRGTAKKRQMTKSNS